MRIEDFDFDLPPELIAQFPAQRRGDSRLLTLDGTTGDLADRRFEALPDLLSPDDLMVFNDTRVMRARLHGSKRSGGRVELLVERVLDADHALALVRASHAPRVDTPIDLPGGAHARVLGRDGDLYRLAFAGVGDLAEYLERHGELPLPPYIARTPGADDDSRYQTVYARESGAVAAPTAGLHFDQSMLHRLDQAGIARAFITLHVGAGTFQPVRSATVEEHRMHAERYWMPEATAEAYATAETFIRFLEATYGGDVLLRLNDAFRAGTTTEAALSEITGSSLVDLDHGFRTWGKATARSFTRRSTAADDGYEDVRRGIRFSREKTQ